MKIIVLAEVRWDYMHHRKRAILSRLPKSWDILYIEPFRHGKKWSRYQDENVRIRSIFCYKRGLDYLFGFVLVRCIVRALNFALIRLGYLGAGARADVAIVSNYSVFDLHRLRLLANKIVVDVNDLPSGFHVPAWVEDNFDTTVTGADRVVVAAPEWRTFRSDSIYIGNGVDFEAFSLHRRHCRVDGHRTATEAG